MKKLDFGQMASVLANVGVIAGIVFLAFELRQNNELLEAETSFAQINVELERRALLIQNPELIELIMKARAGDALTDNERIRLELVTNNILDGYRWQFREYQAGRLPDGYLDLRIWHDVWEFQPRLIELFQEDRPRLDPEFVRFVEENILNTIE